MKLIFLFFLFVGSSYALELEKTKQDAGSVHSQKFTLTPKESRFVKKSNYFDSKEDYRLGTLTTDVKNTEKIVLKLKELLTQIKIADDVLKQKGKSFNDISLENPSHYSSYVLDGFIIKDESILYKDIDELFTKLQALDWKMDKGISLDSKFENLSYISKGKTQKTEKFNIRFSCEKPAVPTICFIKDYGHLLIGK